MKKIALLMLAGSLMAATVVMNIFEELSFTEDKAKEEMVSSFGSGNVNLPYELVQKARSLSSSARAEGIRQLIHYAKDYTKTEEFKKKYIEWRNGRLGYAPERKKKFGIPNPMKMLDKAIDKQLNKGDDEKKFPSDPNKLIKQRLNEFLELSASVDFDAKLTGNRVFVNPDYESKSNEWKMCFRAGKAVVEAAREEVQAWLKELN